MKWLINLASRQTVNKKTFAEAVARHMDLRLDNRQTASVTAIWPRRAESLGLDVTIGRINPR